MLNLGYKWTTAPLLLAFNVTTITLPTTFSNIQWKGFTLYMICNPRYMNLFIQYKLE